MNEQIFDPLEFNVLKGNYLIEASAGTGKTFAITRIFLRALLEGFSISEVLVVTYTKAATRELGERIRMALHTALQVLQGTQSDEKLMKMLKGYEPSLASHYLQRALRNFDDLNVYTIHAFCHQVLNEYALSANIVPHRTLSTQSLDIKRESVLDFWRKHMESAPLEFLQFMRGLDSGLEDWCDFFVQINTVDDWELPFSLASSDANIKKTNTDLQKYITKCREHFALLHQKWPSCREDAKCYIEELRDKTGVSSKIISKLLDDLEQYFQKSEFSLLSFSPKKKNRIADESFERSWNKLWEKAQAKKNVPNCDTEFYKLWTVYRKDYICLLKLLRDYYLLVFQKLCEEYNVCFEQKKQEKRVLFYDDLIIKLHKSLRTSKSLLQRLQKKYRLALIDEFQDTDGLQSKIFQTIFNTPKSEAGLFLIADPKQSIYGFRGSNLYAYLKTRKQVDGIYSLNRNFRSTPDLINSINHLYDSKYIQEPFLMEELKYIPNEAGRNKEQSYFLYDKNDGTWESPQTGIHFYGLGQKGVSRLNDDSIDEKRSFIARSTALKIKQLLDSSESGGLLYKEKKLSAGNIAIIVRKIKQGELMREALEEIGVPALFCHEYDIFETQQVHELLLVLQALCQPSHLSLVKAALGTQLWGYSAEEIYELTQDTSAHVSLLQRCRQYQLSWQTQGFMVMFEEWMRNEKIGIRLLQYAGGERILTNLEHLGELIHLSDHKEPQAVLNYLVCHIEQSGGLGSSNEEKSKLRLSNADPAVQIMTIHYSKGLEFPVVFCPFLWDYYFSVRPRANLELHLPIHILVPQFMKQLLEVSIQGEALSDGVVRTDSIPLGIAFNEKDMKQVMAKENYTEELRLLYVALTRASEQLYIHWCDTSTYAPAAYLFTRGEHSWDTKFSKSKTKNQKESKENIAPQFSQYLFQLAEKFPDSFSYTDLAPEEVLSEFESNFMRIGASKLSHTTSLQANSFTSEVHVLRTLHSFTSLNNRFKKENTFMSDVPTSFIKPHLNESSLFDSILNFPKGAAAGIFFHTLLESIDFKNMFQQREALASLVAQKLIEHNYDVAWQPCLIEYLSLLAQIPLLPDKNVCLADIGQRHSAQELFFHLNLETVSAIKENRIAENNTSDEINLPTPILSMLDSYQKTFQKKILGEHFHFLIGAIDFIFEYEGRYYLLDWKSNYLGSAISDYSLENIEQDMHQAGYHLQYYIYATALDQFLRCRKANYLYENNFGGIIYLYLRGIRSGVYHSIYFDRPSHATLTEFATKLCAR